MSRAKKLFVKVIRADNLSPRDGQGSASSFVVLTFGSQQFRTSTKFRDVNPVWQESFYFDIRGRYDPSDPVLQASVYCVNKLVRGSRSLNGTVRVPDYSRCSTTLYYELQSSGPFSCDVSGQLEMQIYTIPEFLFRLEEPKNASLHSAAAMRLCVEVISAHDLMPEFEQRYWSTFVELSFDYYQFCTAIKIKDLNPVWNERFYCDVWDPSDLAKLDIKAYIYRSNRTLHGKVTIAGASWGSSANAVVMQCPLEKPGMHSRVKGYLLLKVYTVGDPFITTSNPSAPMDSVVNTSDGSFITNSNTSPEMDSAICSDLQVWSNKEIILGNQSSRPQQVPLQHLKEITNNFSDERILGQGGVGVVYKGVLQSGEMIAVKKIASSIMPGMQKQFENEVYHLMMVKHPNIVRFMGYCYETRNACLEYMGKHIFAETAERLLCLEYLPNGSLDKYLSDELSGLNWGLRYKIIEGICYGLRHLHEQNDKPIIHLDLKPANILLDDAMVPKITDFGLSRLVDQKQTIHTSSLDGTLGYMAPEFLHGGTISPKSDIFSLGVIIMEIITGHRDYPDVTRTPSDDFLNLVVEKWKHVLKRSPRRASLETDCEQIKRYIQVGLICVNPDRTKRPPIAKVINMLKGLEGIDCRISNQQAT